ncbi:MAG: hypothetical protein KGZ62_04320 [Sulfurimonas sp.]|nr:hypothetical protein [Sulfurimonas sp.]
MTASRTFDVTDTIDGGEGTDTINITMNSAFTGFTTGSMTGVEVVNLTNAGTVAREFDATGITDAESYTVDATTGLVTIKDMNAIADIALKNQASTASFTTAFATGAAELTATTDTMIFTIENVGTIDNLTTTTTNEEKIVTATLNDVETVNVEATGDNVVAFAGTDLTKLYVAGEGNVKVTSVSTTLTTFDASESTGDITADVTNTAATLTTASTGSGNDILTIGSADIAANGEISGGIGSDKLVYSTAGVKTTQYAMSGFETIALGTLTGALTFSGTNVTDLNTVDVSEIATSGASFVNMGATDLTVKAQGDNSSNIIVSSNNTGVVTLNYVADTATATAIAASTSSVAGDADATAVDFEFTGATEVVVNVGQYFATTGSTITAAEATSVTLNVASGKDVATTPAERTKFDSAITAESATSFTAVIDGEVTATGAITVDAATDANITNGTTAGAMNLQAAALETLTLASSHSFDMTGSDLTAVQTADITMNHGTYTLNTALSEINTLTVAGAGTVSTKLSTASFAALGGDNAYDLTVNASGLKGGFTATTVNTGAGYDINLSLADVTGAVSVDNIGGSTVGDAVTINTAGTTVDLDNITATGNITVTNTSSGVFDLDTVSAGVTGDVSVTLDGTAGAVTMATLAGKNVTLNAGDTIGGFTWDNGAGTTDITAKTSATVVMSELQDNALDILAATGSTALTVALTGGIEDDDVIITTVATNTSVTVTGSLDIGDNTLKVNNNTSTAASTISIAGVTNYDVSALLGGTNTDTITGGAGSDYIDGHTGTDIDTLVGGAGNDTYAITDAGAADVLVEATTGGGTDTLLFTSDLSVEGFKFHATAAASAVADASLANIEQIVLANDKDATFDSDQVTGLSLALNTVTGVAASVVIINGDDAVADTIDISDFTVAAVTYTDATMASATGIAYNLGDDTVRIDGGTGADVITLNTLTSDVVYVTLDSANGGTEVTDSSTTAYDQVTGFTIASDVLYMRDADTGGTAADMDTATNVTADDTTLGNYEITIATGVVTGITLGSGAAAVAQVIGTTATVDELSEIVAILQASTDISANQAVVFEFDGDTYVYGNDQTTGASTGDTLVQLIDVTGVASLSDALGVLTLA